VASNDVSISIILVGEKTNIPVTRLSCFHYSVCLFDAHVLYKATKQSYINGKRGNNQIQNTSRNSVLGAQMC
jgi:hypothetical protein